jgi:glycosyltransferase involved in cell wall biosynthesis
MIRISVVVPFYNSESYILQCIEGLLSQSYPRQNYEIIMVDNNSTDSSAETVKSYSRIKLVFEGKLGAYAARNRGVREATGEIIAFTDADCVPSSNWLQEIEETITHSGVGIVIGSHGLARDSFFLSLLEDYEHEKNNYIFSSDIRELYYGYTRNMAVLKRLLDEMGPFVERARGSDAILVCKCVEMHSCAIVHYSPKIRVRHMEIDSPGKYFRKVFVYGRSAQQYREIVCSRPLNNWERFLIFRRTVRSQRYSWTQSLSLLGLLAIGFGYWVLGSIRAERVSCMHDRSKTEN